MTQSRNVTATFSGATTGTGFTLTVSVTGNGTVTGGGISCGSGATACTSAGHAANSAVTLTATPSSGATFTGWGGGTCTGTVPTCTVTFNAAKTVTAAFSGGTSTFALTVSAAGPGRVTGNGINCGNGATTCTATFTPGTTAVLSQSPASGASFRGWGGSCTGTAATCTVSMTAAKSVSATFAAAGTPGTLTVRVLGRGSVSTSAGACSSTGGTKTCVQHFKAGASAALTARAAAGQSFLGWSGACTGKKTTCAVKLTTAQSADCDVQQHAGEDGDASLPRASDRRQDEHGLPSHTPLREHQGRDSPGPGHSRRSCGHAPSLPRWPPAASASGRSRFSGRASMYSRRGSRAGSCGRRPAWGAAGPPRRLRRSHSRASRRR